MLSNNRYSFFGNDIIISNENKRATVNLWYVSFRSIMKKIEKSEYSMREKEKAKFYIENANMIPIAIEAYASIDSKEKFTAYEFFHGLQYVLHYTLTHKTKPSVIYFYTDSIKKMRIFMNILEKEGYIPWFHMQDMYFFKGDNVWQ